MHICRALFQTERSTEIACYSIVFFSFFLSFSSVSFIWFAFFFCYKYSFFCVTLSMQSKPTIVLIIHRVQKWIRIIGCFGSWSLFIFYSFYTIPNRDIHLMMKTTTISTMIVITMTYFFFQKKKLIIIIVSAK